MGFPLRSLLFLRHSLKALVFAGSLRLLLSLSSRYSFSLKSPAMLLGFSPAVHCSQTHGPAEPLSSKPGTNISFTGCSQAPQTHPMLHENDHPFPTVVFSLIFYSKELESPLTLFPTFLILSPILVFHLHYTSVVTQYLVLRSLSTLVYLQLNMFIQF